jgi:hypothetical protein
VATYDEQKNIYIEGKHVSLVYFRAGYTEKDYFDEVILYLI